MQLRPLGRSGLQVAPLAFGGNVFGWTADEATSFALLDAFVDAGFNLVDTADVYSRWAPGHVGGESETVIGRWLKKSGKRDRIVLATKVGKDMGVGPQGPRIGLSAKYIGQAVDASLRRLQTDRIDLYQSHDDDASTPLEETLGAYADLIRAGKVRAIGASNHSARRLAEALATSLRLGLPRYESLQPLYNLVDRAPFEAELEPLCRAEGLGVINFYGLARGFLTGKYRSEADMAASPRGPGVKGGLLQRARLARARGARPRRRAPERDTGTGRARVADRPAVDPAPIASATSVEQLRELLGALTLQLGADDVAELDAASAWVGA